MRIYHFDIRQLIFFFFISHFIFLFQVLSLTYKTSFFNYSQKIIFQKQKKIINRGEIEIDICSSCSLMYFLCLKLDYCSSRNLYCREFCNHDLLECYFDIDFFMILDYDRKFLFFNRVKLMVKVLFYPFIHNF